MSMNWDEVKKLQDEFAKAQMSGSVSKISEKNCIQIIQKLQELELIELLYTSDGKQYLTYDQLEKEIKEEVYVGGGRINVGSLQDVLNVDISRIEIAVEKLVKSDPELHLIQGELLDRSYVDTVAIEINDLLLESGQVSIGDLCKRFNLPSDFLVNTRLVSAESFDRGSVFTDAFVQRQTAQILGVFSAVTRPTSISSLASRYDFHDKLFSGVLTDLISSGRLAGSLSGRGDKAEYIPALQKKTQERFIKNFYNENQYIEFDTVKRLGIKNAKSHLKKTFPDGVPLETCHVGQSIVDNVAGSVDEALSTCEPIDIMMLIPSVCTKQDASSLLGRLPAVKKSKTTRILNDSFICGDDFVSKCAEIFKETMEKKAKEVAATSKKSQSQHSAPVNSTPASVEVDGEFDKKADKKAKRRAKKNKRAEEEQAAEDSSGKKGGVEMQWTFMSAKEIQSKLERSFPDHADVMEEVAGLLHLQLSKRFQEYVKEAFLAGVENAGRKSDRNKLQKEYSELYVKARLFQLGVEQFDGQPRETLSKFLLKSIGSSLLNLICETRAQDEFVDAEFSPEMTVDSRGKAIKKFPDQSRLELEKINQLLNGKVIDEFLDSLEDMGSVLGFMVKRTDKKRDRQVLFENKYALLQQLETETSAPTVLHLVSVLLFQQQTSCMLHAAGRSVPEIVKFLKERLSPEVHVQLLDYQEAVMSSLTKDESTGPTHEQTEQLKNLLKKPSQE